MGSRLQALRLRRWERRWRHVPPREEWELGDDAARQIPGQDGLPCVLDWPVYFENYWIDG